MSVVSLPLRILAAVAALTTLPGCYYGHLVVGQTRLLWASRPIDDVLSDTATSDPLRAKLLLVRAAKLYAGELGLEVAGQYTAYLPWPGDRIVTTVVATRPSEVEPAGFWFPVLGRLPYKGFFEPERADREANRLRERGLDVCVSAVPAYSTLGWLDDPITQPMLQTSDGRLVETIVHELVHATVYAKGEPAFNESIATFIGQQAAIEFFADGPEALAEEARVRDARQLARTLEQFRRDVQSLYARAATASDAASEKEIAIRRAALETNLRSQIAELPLEATDREAGESVARRVRLNDACLALRGTYADDLERHASVFAALQGDLAALVARLRAAAESDDVRANFFKSDASPRKPIAAIQPSESR